MQLEVFLQQAKPIDWVIEGLIPFNQKGLIVARAGGGKSWHVESLALSVTSGTDFLSHYRVAKPGPVLLVDQDTPKEVLAERLRALQKCLGASPLHDLFVESYEGYAIDQKAGAAKLAKEVAQVHPVLIILETLDTVTSSSFNENRLADVRRLFDTLNQIQAKHPCAILLSHHFGKRGHIGEPMTWIRGSSALPARVDVGYGLRRVTGPGNVCTFLIQPFPKRVRTAPGFQTELSTMEQGGRLTAATLRWVRDWDSDLDPELMDKRATVLDLMRDRGSEGVTVNDVQTASEGYLGQKAVRAVLDSLVGEGLAAKGVEAHGRFRFWAAGYVPQTSDAVESPVGSPAEGGQWKPL